MNWHRLVFRDQHDPDERSRKGAELIELQAQSIRAIQRAEQAIAERERVAVAVRNTVRAMRGGPLT